MAGAKTVVEFFSAAKRVGAVFAVDSLQGDRCFSDISPLQILIRMRGGDEFFVRMIHCSME
jgi:hypothetical protein